MCEFHCHLVRIRKSMGVVKPLPIVHNLRGKIEGRGRKGRHARKRERVWWEGMVGFWIYIYFPLFLDG